MSVSGRELESDLKRLMQPSALFAIYQAFM